MKRFLVILLLLIAACAAPAAAYDEADLKELLAENERLAALVEFKDSAAMIEVKLKQLDYINEYRRKYGAPELKLDILAGRVGNMHAFNAVENGYFGHWDLNGCKPYARYGLAGGLDHVSENTWRGLGEFSGAGFTMEDSKCSDTDEAKILAAMKEGLDSFMAEGPGGGHHDNVVAPFHTHAGLGFHCETTRAGDEMKYTIIYNEEFLNRYIEFENFKRNVKRGEKITIAGKVIPPDTGAYAAIAYYEPFPKPMSPKAILATGSYADFTPDRPLSLWPWDMKFDRATRRFSFDFTPAKDGLYYIQIYVKKGIAAIPYEPGPGSTKVTTDGIPPASGIIVSAGE